ncbi:gephyrin-like molybdotransferase Glp [Beijerinckia sp. L45]|uniref:molybdopterin molybdotransferase MoeA n=1 Tax=Beijerinckia sp. L45 TaxID=1641855 RepID=UPI00131CC46A|nr:gephyrin-like molybdotransferase Glp [Beijerinckia sp. L45]
MSDGLLSVAEALARVLASAKAMPTEMVPLHLARGRTLTEDLKAMRTQPPVAMSAMDGYAVRAADLAAGAPPLQLVGQSAAGLRYGATLQPGETVRIFTGAPVPDGADTILIQEDAIADGDRIRATAVPLAGRNIRRAGLDFTFGEMLLPAGTRLGAAELALAAAMDHPRVPVARKPLVAIIATGDELVQPGAHAGRDQIVASNSFAIAAFVDAAGGTVLDLGIVVDQLEPLVAAIRAARDAKADILITLGGASVGDHDLVKPALAEEGMELGFWRIAMRPGKPLIHGHLGAMAILGLPGNPVSSIVCSALFLVPLVRALSGDKTAHIDRSEPAILGVALKANDKRQDYMRAALTLRDDGTPVAVPNIVQDSSMLRVLAQAQCLVIREPNAPAAEAGAPCRILRFEQGW